MITTSLKSRKAFDQSKIYLQRWINKEIALSELYHFVKPNIFYFTNEMKIENNKIENDMNTIFLMENYHSMNKHIHNIIKH